MASLAKCLDQITDLSQIEKDAILESHGIYLKEGEKPKDARIKAVQDAISDIDKEQQDIIKQIREVSPELADSLLPPQKPKSAPESTKEKPVQEVVPELERAEAVSGSEEIAEKQPAPTEEAEGKEPWRDTSKWDIPDFKADPIKEEFMGIISEETPEESIKRQEDSFKANRKYEPPVKSKFFQQENIDEISTALLAAKEGKMDWQELQDVVYKNLPLPPVEEHGSGMVGDIYGGTVKDNVLHILGLYLENKLQAYDPVKKELIFYPKEDISKMPEPKKEEYGDEYGWRVGNTHLHDTKESAIQEWISTHSGGPDTRYNTAQPGGPYYRMFPDSYDKLIKEFRSKPLKFFRNVLGLIKEFQEEDQAGLDILMSYYGPEGEFNPDAIIRRQQEEIEKRRKSIKVVKTETKKAAKAEEAGEVSDYLYWDIKKDIENKYAKNKQWNLLFYNEKGQRTSSEHFKTQSDAIYKKDRVVSGVISKKYGSIPRKYKHISELNREKTSNISKENALRIEKPFFDKLKEAVEESKPTEGKEKIEGESEGLPIEANLDDIPYDLAYSAHVASSFSPEKRAKQRQEEYIRYLEQMYNKFKNHAKTDEQKQILRSELSRYKTGLIKRLKEILQAESRTMSSMVTGPANFPVARNKKRLATVDKKYKEFTEWNKKVEKSISKSILGPQVISSDMEDAVEQLQKKIDDAERLQETMKQANRIIKNKKLSDSEKIQKLKKETELTDKQAEEIMKPDYMGRKGFAAFNLQNNNANIRRMKDRIKDIEKKRSDETTEIGFEGGIIVDNVEDNRVQILFDDKPDADIRKALKQRGFRWAPSKGAWQRQRSSDAMRIAKNILKVEGDNTNYATTQTPLKPVKITRKVLKQGFPENTRLKEQPEGFIATLPGGKQVWVYTNTGLLAIKPEAMRKEYGRDPKETEKAIAAWTQIDGQGIMFLSGYTDSRSIPELVRHEVFHAGEETLTPAQLRGLRKDYKTSAEAADAYAEWDGKSRVKGYTFFQKIRRFFRRIANTLFPNIIDPTSGQVFENIRSGKVFENAQSNEAVTGNAVAETGDITQTKEFKDFFGKSKVTVDGKAGSEPLVVYRGDYRVDKVGQEFKSVEVEEGGSGGIFFTDNPDIASSYSENKPFIDEYAYDPRKHTKVTIKGKEIPLSKAGLRLSLKDKKTIENMVLSYGENPNTFEYDFSGIDPMIGRQTWDKYLKEARGNYLDAFHNIFMESGIIIESEEFLDILKQAKIFDSISYDNPYISKSGVTPVYLRIENPLEVSNITDDILNKIQEKIGKEDVILESLKSAKDNNLSETITMLTPEFKKALMDLGYDGIKDIGGVITGGEKHNVYIAFEPTQIKSIYNRGTFDKNDPRISYALPKDATPEQAADKYNLVYEGKLIHERINLTTYNFHTKDGYSITVSDIKDIPKRLADIETQKANVSYAVTDITDVPESFLKSVKKKINNFGGYGSKSNNDKAKEVLTRKFDDFMYWVVDKNRPIQSVQNKLKNIREDIDLFLRETQRPKITAAKINEYWEDKIEPMLKEFGKRKISLPDFEEYAHAKHAKERNQAMREANSKRYLEDMLKLLPVEDRDNLSELMKEDLYPKEYYARFQDALKEYGNLNAIKDLKDRWESFSERPSGMSDSESIDILDRYKNSKDMEDLRLMLSDINNTKLDILYGAGLLPEEEYKQIKNKYKFYVPLYREGYENSYRGSGRGLQPAGRPIKTAMGSTRNVVNIMANSVSNLENAVARAEKAQSAKVLYDLINDNPNSDIWKIGKVKKSPTHDSAGNIKLYPDLFNVAPNEMRIMIDGEQYLVTVNIDNKDAMLMLRTLKAEDNMSGPMLNALSKMNRWLARINTSWSPEFMLSNFVRDIQTAGINVKDTGVESKRMLRGALDSLKSIYAVERGKRKGSELESYYDRFKKAGGKIGWADIHGSVDNLTKKITKEIETNAGQRPVRKTITGWLQWVEDTNTSIENGVRLHVFKMATEQGMTDRKAAQIASDLTVDFTKKGAAGPLINSLYLFANAGIQGSYRIMRAGAKSPKVRKIMAGIIGAGLLNGLLNSAIGGDDDDGEDYYNKLDDYIQERNMIFMIPGTKGKYAKIPLPWGYNLFWNIGTEISKVFTKKNYNPITGAGRLGRVFVEAFNPIQSGTLLQTLSPTITDPFAMVAENKNWFGGELMPEKNIFEKVPTPDSQRYWSTVRSPSKWVASMLNNLTGGSKIRKGFIDVSPETLDLIIDTAGGSMLRFFTDSFGTPYKLMREEKTNIFKAPFVRRFAGQKSEYADQRIYYENLTQVLTAKEELETYKNTEFVRELNIELKNIKKMIPFAEQTEKRIRKFRRIRNRTENKQTIERMNNLIEKEYMRFNKRYYETMK